MVHLDRVRRIGERMGWSRERIDRLIASRGDLMLVKAARQRRDLDPEAATSLLVYMRTIEERLEELEENRTRAPRPERP